MAVEDAIVALRDHWDDVVSRLGAEGSQQLRDLVEELGGPGHNRAATGLADMLVEVLSPDHPVRRALVQGYLLAPAVVDWPALKLSLHTLAWRLPDAGLRAGDSILTQVLARLLRTPALTEEEVRRRGANPADTGLIRLDRPDGGHQWPEFQFGPGGDLLPVVRAVNELLDAASDPIGAADWWLSRNMWLDGQPSLLIGMVPGDHLVRAARAVGAEV